MRSFIAVVTMTCAAGTVFASGFKSPPTFSAHSQLVNVAITVTDKKGEFINDLAPEDFVILEDSVRQEVAVLDRRAPPTDLVLMLDASGSMGTVIGAETMLDIAKKAARQFVVSLRPDDKIMVLAFSNVTHRYHTSDGELFTTDKAFLERTIDIIGTEQDPGRRSGSTSLYTSLYAVLKEVLGKTYRRTQDPEHPRRPIIVMLTDGIDTSSMVTSDQVLDQARTAGVSVYSIVLPRRAFAGSDWQEIHDGRYFIDQLAKETGGSVHQLTSMNGLRKAYDFIARELCTQYRLGYQPSAQKIDGKWHYIQVVVSGRPDLTVRHRQGYYASKP